MDPLTITAISSLIVAVIGGMTVMVRAFLTHINTKDTQFTSFLSNHLSSNTTAMQNVANQLEAMTEGIDILHLDNKEVRERLAYSDTHVTRKVEEQNMSSIARRLDALEIWERLEKERQKET